MGDFTGVRNSVSSTDCHEPAPRTTHLRTVLEGTTSGGPASRHRRAETAPTPVDLEGNVEISGWVFGSGGRELVALMSVDRQAPAERQCDGAI
jgi:hypothetical protein